MRNYQAFLASKSKEGSRETSNENTHTAHKESPSESEISSDSEDEKRNTAPDFTIEELVRMFESRPPKEIQVPKYFKRHIQKEYKNYFYETLTKIWEKRGINLAEDLEN